MLFFQWKGVEVVKASGPDGFPLDMAGVERELRSRIEAQRIVGLSLAVSRPGSVAWNTNYGHADLTTAAPSSTETSYLWFSMTKIVTATAVMQLVEDGSVNLDSTIRNYVPEFGVVRQSEAVTVRHLLSHSSGLSNPAPVRWLHPAGTPGPEPRRFLASLLRRHAKLRFRPGARARYTNLGYLVLGQLIADVSGGSYTDFATRRILVPLGMTRTGFEGGRGPHEATVYQRTPRALVPLLRLALPRRTVGERIGRWVGYPPFRLHGAAYGGLVGPVGDAACFVAAHLNRGELDGTRILERSSVDLMQQLETPGRPYDVGLGWYRPAKVRNRSPRFIEHLGGGLGVYNSMRLYPDRQLGVVVMANSPGYDLEALLTPIVEAFS